MTWSASFHLLGFLSALALLAAPGCSSDDDDGSGSGTDTGDGGTDTGDGGTDTSSTDTGGGSSGSTGGSGTGGTDTDTSGSTSGSGTTGPCDPYMSDDAGPAVEVTIRNDTDGVIYVQQAWQCQLLPPFVILDEGDAPLDWYLEFCPQICEGPCGDCGCAADGLIQIEPGGLYAAAWQGSHLEPATIPQECADLWSCGTQCSVERQSPDGTYTLQATATTEGACDGGGCACEPNDDGWCIVEGTPSGSELSTETDLDYPTATTAELSFS